MGKIVGRSDDMLIIRGVNLFPTQIEEIVLGHGQLSGQYQLVVTREGTLDAVEVRCEMLPAHAAADRAAVGEWLRHRIKTMIGITTSVDVGMPDSLERTLVGKARRSHRQEEQMKLLSACWRLALACASVAAMASQPLRAADLIPVAAFVAEPDLSAVKLSPSGKFIALTVANKSGRTLLAVTDVELSKPPVVVAVTDSADINAFEWVNDDYLVFNLVDLQSAARQQGFGPGLFSVRRDGSQTRNLIRLRYDEFTTGTSIASTQLDPSHFFMRTLRDGTNDVIVGQARFDGFGEVVGVTPKRLDVSTGRARAAVDGAPERATGWVFDSKGNARVAVTRRDGWVETFWHAGDGVPWQSILRAQSLEQPWSALAVDAGGHLYVEAGSSGGTEVIKRFDAATGKPEPQPLASAPGFDLEGGLIFSDRGDRLLGLRVVTDAETTIWFDDERRKLQAQVDARFPARINRITCASQCGEDDTVLVKSFSDHDPGVFTLFQPKAQTWTTVGPVRPLIDPRRMADLDFPSRQGARRARAADLGHPAEGCQGPASGGALGARRTVGSRRGLGVGRRGAAAGLAGLRGDRARVSRQHRLRPVSSFARAGRTGARRCRTISRIPSAGRPTRASWTRSECASSARATAAMRR